MQKEILLIPATDSTPRIELNPISNKYIIEGGSLPFNANILYDPVLYWLAEYGEKRMENVVFEINLNYFNTPTTMQLSKIFKILEQLVVTKKKDILVKWTYLDDDDKDEILETFCSEVNIPFKLEQVSKLNTKPLKNDPSKAVRKSYASASDEILIKKCTKVLNYVISNSIWGKKEATATINDIYDSIGQDIPKDEIEYILDSFFHTKGTFLKKFHTDSGEHGYVVNLTENK